MPEKPERVKLSAVPKRVRRKEKLLPRYPRAEKILLFKFLPQPLSTLALLRSERSHVYGEPVLHIRLQQSFVGFVDLLDRNHFHIGSNVVRAAKVKHLLGLTETADERAGKTAAACNKAKGDDAERLRENTNGGKVAVDVKQINIGVDVMCS